MTYDQLVAEAERLSPAERAEFAHRLLATLEDAPSEGDGAVGPLIAQRLADHDAGRTKAVPAVTFLEELHREFP